ncbi:MNIO family bufferin maturase [Neptunicoccus cionae]|uniref:MNIO family bufferin maturase n=1 Tax=Neptunicoccus cionae TaxID=2035344 RepID=UPI000C7583CB|nr:DUF692 domain-containing protein [Amylibacter cionae]PLS20355.1 hypothetical protein C0U40_17100 [Amylibacter cionae]
MLDTQSNRPDQVPNRAGVGFKAQHLDGILQNPESIGWIEIHAENYMGDGGRPIAQLRHLRERFPVSCHGVGLSIGAEGPLDVDHLNRLKKLVDWLQPGLFSEHLAWSTHDSHFLNDLLPVPYTQATVDRVVAHIDQVQDTVGRQMLLENPSTYVAFEESDRSEIDFLQEVAQRSGCGLLLDVNNVFVSATNQNYSPEGYIDAFPTHLVGELHLGGHEQDADDFGATLLIDSHSRPVVDPVWALYEYTLAKAGPRPTLIEWDNDIPEWDVLANEAARADRLLSAAPAARAN